MTPTTPAVATDSAASEPQDFNPDFDISDADLNAVTGAETAEEPADDTAEEPVVGDADDEEAPAEQEEATDETEPEAEAAKPETEEAAKPGEELPDGVTRSQDGKRIFVTPNRWEHIYGGYKALREMQQVIGEPPTKEALESRHAAWVGSGKMHDDFASADPQRQTGFIAHWLKMSKTMTDMGKPDPMVSFAETLLPTLQRAHPAAFGKIISDATAKALDGIYQYAAADPTTHKDLLLAVQYIDRELTGKYRKPEDLQVADPISDRERSVAEREKALNRQSQERDTQEWNGFIQNMAQQRGQVISGLVTSALTPLAAAYKEMPETFKAIQGQLGNEVLQSLNGDPKWSDIVGRLLSTAQQYPGQRQAVANDFVQRVKARVEDFLATRAPAIIREQNKAVVAQNAAIRQRRAAGETNKAPGGGAPPKQSLVPPVKRDGYASSESIMADLSKFLG